MSTNIDTQTRESNIASCKMNAAHHKMRINIPVPDLKLVRG
jgi:hypothetical protein